LSFIRAVVPFTTVAVFLGDRKDLQHISLATVILRMLEKLAIWTNTECHSNVGSVSYDMSFNQCDIAVLCVIAMLSFSVLQWCSVRMLATTCLHPAVWTTSSLWYACWPYC